MGDRKLERAIVDGRKQAESWSRSAPPKFSKKDRNVTVTAGKRVLCRLAIAGINKRDCDSYLSEYA